jgi:uncharacterized membrane protein
MSNGTDHPYSEDTAWEHPLRSLVRTLERESSLDPRAATLDGVARPLASGPAGPLLSGAQLGHALHPLLTDFPLGCWTSASLLDLIGGRSARPAAQRLVGLGLLGTVPTVLSGLVEFDGIDSQSDRRVATAHAIGNSVASGCQVMSWRARRRDRHLRGAVWTFAGNGVVALAGYLGGHLLSAQGVGVGPRGPLVDDEQDATPAAPPDVDVSSTGDELDQAPSAVPAM